MLVEVPLLGNTGQVILHRGAAALCVQTLLFLARCNLEKKAQLNLLLLMSASRTSLLQRGLEQDVARQAEQRCRLDIVIPGLGQFLQRGVAISLFELKPSYS